LTITGTSLPTEDVKVQIANSRCEEVTASETEITCTVDVGVAAGSWDVQVSDANGLIAKQVDVATIDVPLVVESVTKTDMTAGRRMLLDTDLNQLGGDILTITGTGFD
jgi:hypothetical protein